MASRGTSGLCLCKWASADTISFGGQILQSAQDGTGPAVSKPGLNDIQDLQTYLVTLNFSGSITTPGTYDLTGASLAFGHLAAAASESAFGPISLCVANS